MKFTKTWKSSVQPRRQRKYRKNAPLHIRSSFMHVHLSKELRTTYKRRNALVKKGDTITILRGTFRGKSGVIDRTNHKQCKVYVTGIDRQRKDGSKAFYPLQPSNLMITNLVTPEKRFGEKKQ